MRFFDRLFNPEKLVESDTLLRVYVWTPGQSGQQERQIELEVTKKELLESVGYYRSLGSYIFNVYDMKSNRLDKLSDELAELTGYNEYERKNRDRLDLVFYDGPAGSFGYKESEEKLFDGNLRALNPLNSRYFEEYNIEYLYHMTSYRNIQNIMEFGLYPHGNRYVESTIDNEDVNKLRQKHDPIYDRPIHEYVPFYFNPRNPMMYVNLDDQDDIIILCIEPRSMLIEDSVFTDGNAASGESNFYDELEDLSKLDWQCIRSNRWDYFEDGKRKKMAEILISDHVDSKFIKKIICYDHATADYVEPYADEDIIEVDQSFYFDRY